MMNTLTGCSNSTPKCLAFCIAIPAKQQSDQPDVKAGFVIILKLVYVINWFKKRAGNSNKLPGRCCKKNWVCKV